MVQNVCIIIGQHEYDGIPCIYLVLQYRSICFVLTKQLHQNNPKLEFHRRMRVREMGKIGAGRRGRRRGEERGG